MSRGELHRRLIDTLWYGRNPFEGFPKSLYAVDQQGWRSEHPYLLDAIRAIRPRIVVEIGVWKGLSTLYMAKCMKDHQIEGVVIGVDTWLGAVDHWMREDLFDELCFDNGFPSFYRKFIANVVQTGHTDAVVPLPIDSINAAHLLLGKGIVADIIHLDAGHEFESVCSDLEAWWPVLRQGGILIGDDYEVGGGHFPGVAKAFDAFCATRNLGPPQALDGKCLVRK